MSLIAKVLICFGFVKDKYKFNIAWRLGDLINRSNTLMKCWDKQKDSDEDNSTNAANTLLIVYQGKAFYARYQTQVLHKKE